MVDVYDSPVRVRTFFSGDSWTRTNDPFDVNEVLYRLSHASLPFDVPTTLDYQLSHATITGL